MGTNYYLYDRLIEACPSCGYDGKRLHIGKKSWGWCFALHVIPEEGINSLGDWIVRWQSGEIRDEYRDKISPSEMEEIIRKLEPQNIWNERLDEDFYKKNNCEKGPNGLLRACISDRCVGHGKGPWDLFACDFS